MQLPGKQAGAASRHGEAAKHAGQGVHCRGCPHLIVILILVIIHLCIRRGAGEWWALGPHSKQCRVSLQRRRLDSAAAALLRSLNPSAP